MNTENKNKVNTSSETPLSATEDFEQKINEIATFSSIGKELTSPIELKNVFRALTDQIRKLMAPCNWSLLLLDESGENLIFEIAIGEKAEKLHGMTYKIGEGIAGWVTKNERPKLIQDVSKEPLFSSKADELTDFKTKSVVCVPLKVRGNCLGVIELINTADEKTFTDSDLLLLTTIADYAAIAIDNAKLFKQIEKLTVTDDLTGLHNSRYLHSYLASEIERAKRYEYDLSMVFFDLDHFKEVNDTHGHLCGSKMLSEVADVVLETLRKSDVACRYGGDEFVILMPETSKENAVDVANKLRDAINKAVYLVEEGISCKVTASFGIACFPDDAKNEDELINMADVAMYQVKNNKRDAVAAI
ncbi:MAG: sensor domain-containing diguanylate cyclase [Deltaproteobacteria bacterium]|nr:sensor domain-containing diguanylate cyclase [Deltaproteobacteria bacterium]